MTAAVPYGRITQKAVAGLGHPHPVDDRGPRL